MKPAHHLNFRQVETFKAVYECGSMTMAAERLGISQPAVSKLIAALEKRIGFEVFDRRIGRSIATAEGRLLYEDVERALVGIESLAEKALAIRERRYGRLAIGAMPALSLGLIQNLIAELFAEHPDVTISMQTRTSPQLLNLIAARQLDVAVIAHLGRNPQVHIESLHRIGMVCVVPADHPLAQKQVIEARDIADEPLISLSTLDQLRQRIEVMLMNEGIRPRCRIDTALAVSACAFVAKKLGVAIVDPFSARFFPSSAIAMRPFEPRIELEVAVVRPEEVQPPPASLTAEVIAMLQMTLDRDPLD